MCVCVCVCVCVRGSEHVSSFEAEAFFRPMFSYFQYTRLTPFQVLPFHFFNFQTLILTSVFLYVVTFSDTHTLGFLFVLVFLKVAGHRYSVL